MKEFGHPEGWPFLLQFTGESQFPEVVSAMRKTLLPWSFLVVSSLMVLGSIGTTSAEDPIPFMQDVAGKYTIEVKLLNFGPPEAYTNTNDPYVALFHNWKGKTMNGILVIDAVSPTQGKVKLTSADSKTTVNLPFRYDSKTGLISLDQKVAELGGNRIKIDATARLVSRGDRYAGQVEGTLMAIDPQGEQKGWLKFGFQGKATSVLEKTVPNITKPKTVYPPNTRRRDSGARFSDLSGQVEICPYDYDRKTYEESSRDVAKMGMIIYTEDLIITGEESGALISFSDMTSFQVGANTQIVIETPPERDSKLKLLIGTIWVNINKMIKDGTMETHMSQAVTGTKGTIYSCRETGTTSELKVFEGAVVMKHKKTGKEQLVSAGQTLVATSEGFSELTTFDVPSEKAKWTKPSAKAPTTRPAPTAITGPWVHPSKAFQLKATEGWGYVPNYRNKVADRDADTLIDSTQQIALSLMKHPNPIIDARTAFGRWLAGISRGLSQPGMRDLRVEKLTLGRIQGWRVCYRLDSPVVISRLFFVHQGQSYVLNAIYPVDFGQAELPRSVVELLNSLEFLKVDTAPDTSTLGVEKFRTAELEGLSKDFSLVAYERGVVLHDNVRKLEQVVRAEHPHFTMHDNVASLLKDDQAMREQLGKATSAVVALFDHRFNVQLYEHGVALHDPVTSVVWVKVIK